MPPILSKSSVLKCKPRKINVSNTQTHVAQRHKIYSELPMIDIRNSCNNIPVINSSAQFTQESISFFPNDLERSFHLGLLSTCTDSQHVAELINFQSSDSTSRPGNKLILKEYISNSGCGKNTLNYKERYPTFFNEENAHHFMKDGKVHQTYLSRKRTRKSLQQHLAAKRFLTSTVAEGIGHYQAAQGHSTKETSHDCEDVAFLLQQHANYMSTERDGAQTPEHDDADHATVASELGLGQTSAVKVLSKRGKHVTFADEVDRRPMSEQEEYNALQQADFMKCASRKPSFCEADEHPVLTSDLQRVDQCPEDDSEFSDSPFLLSQKYCKQKVRFEDWKLTEPDELQELKLYEDHNVQQTTMCSN